MLLSPSFYIFFAFWSDHSSEILITIKFTSHKKKNGQKRQKALTMRWIVKRIKKMCVRHWV